MAVCVYVIATARSPALSVWDLGGGRNFAILLSSLWITLQLFKSSPPSTAVSSLLNRHYTLVLYMKLVFPQWIPFYPIAFILLLMSVFTLHFIQMCVVVKGGDSWWACCLAKTSVYRFSLRLKRGGGRQGPSIKSLGVTRACVCSLDFRPVKTATEGYCKLSLFVIWHCMWHGVCL